MESVLGEAGHNGTNDGVNSEESCNTHSDHGSDVWLSRNHEHRYPYKESLIPAVVQGRLNGGGSDSPFSWFGGSHSATFHCRTSDGSCT